MNSLTCILALLGVFLPSSFGSVKECPERGDGKVDWTTKDQIWYHCQTSQANRISNNCYVNFKKTVEGKSDAVISTFDAECKKEVSFTLQIERISDGKYYYPESGNTAMNLRVSSDRKCLAYWKCHDDTGNWDGVPGSGGYFMFMCNDPSLCKPQNQYTCNYKKIFKEAKHMKNVTKIFDLSQEECKKLKIQP